jgi:serine protease Do
VELSRYSSGGSVYMAVAATLLLVFAASCGFLPQSNTNEKGDGKRDGEKSGAVSELADVQKATIQIEGTGSFRNPDPAVGLETNVIGSGSGFIIDPSGIAVTNNHVVTGMASLEVFVNDESYNAQVLGVSECSDLAVIDIEGEGFPFLEWREGDIEPTLEVWATGFPLGDPEYTATEGSISKADADGESSWASVDAVLEHTATINPGNSGGPLVDEDGKVVGVNYAGDDEAVQYFAIARDEAREILTQLEAGQNVTSIGVNGVAPAVAGEAGDSTGVWVSSVESGSPADKTGVKAGDIITKLEGVELATEDSDGPMADYCDILRTNSADDTLGVEVVRFDTQEVLEGQLNGRELKQTFSFAEEASEELESETTTGDSGGDEYSGYTSITDDSEALQVSVPNEWTDTNGGAWEFEGEEVGASVSASTDLAAYADQWDIPGMFFGASSSLASEYEVDSLLDYFDYSETCDYDARYDYEDAAYTGKYDLWTDCDGTGSQFLVLVAAPEDGSYLTVVQIQAVTPADIPASEEILGSFVVVGEV